MAKWIECWKGLPKKGPRVLVEYFSGDFEKIKYTGNLDEWWGKNIKQWLDESEDNTPTFTIKDMEAAYDAGIENEKDYWSSNFEKFMREKYNIELLD